MLKYKLKCVKKNHSSQSYIDNLWFHNDFHFNAQRPYTFIEMGNIGRGQSFAVLKLFFGHTCTCSSNFVFAWLETLAWNAKPDWFHRINISRQFGPCSSGPDYNIQGEKCQTSYFIFYFFLKMLYVNWQTLLPWRSSIQLKIRHTFAWTLSEANFKKFRTFYILIICSSFFKKF